MAKLIPMPEAAQLLGLTVEQLNDLRSKQEIFGYRDGSSWKFKEEEIQRVAAMRAADRGSDLGQGEIEGSADRELGIDDDLEQLVDLTDSEAGAAEGDIDTELVLADDSESEAGRDSDSSTVIGDDDLALDDELQLETSDDELQLAPEESDELSLSDERGATEEEVGSDADVLGQSPGKADQPSDVDSDELHLAPDDDFELSTSELATEGDADDFSLSDAELDLDTDSEVDLVVESESPVEAAADDGISLDGAPTELATSADDFALDDDLLVEDTGDSTQLKADNDFLLTPVGEESAADESDSGSQVIELDEDFEASDEPLITEEEEEEALEETTEPAVRAAAAPTVEYSLWNVLGLFLIILVFLPTCIMMIDLMLNMWSWSGTSSLNSSLMDGILSVFGV